MKVWIIRHGETSGNEAGLLRGPVSANDELNATGHAQARALATHLLDTPGPPQTVYASPYLRARQTAAPLAVLLGCPVRVLDGLQELDCGVWAGQPYSALSRQVSALRMADGRLGFSGGESFGGVAARFVAALNSLPVGEDAALVSHGGVMRIGLAALLGLDAEQVWSRGQLIHGNTDYSVLVRGADGWTASALGVKVTQQH